MRWLRYWIPAGVWAVVISFASTGHFTSEKTAGHILPILRWLMPQASAEKLNIIHHFIRKGGHIFEYFVFALLLLYAVRGGRREWRWSWAAIALMCVAVYAGADEFHQSFVPGRGPSVWDALLDTAAGTMALWIAWSWWRWRAGKKFAGGVTTKKDAGLKAGAT